jgi:hypothetical protein
MKNAIYSIALLLVAFLSSSISGFSQAKEIKARLLEYKIDEDRLSSNLREEDAVHYYKLKSLTGGKEGNIETVAEYDPRKKISERWTLLTVNDQPPEKSDLKDFKKIHNPKKKHITGKIDQSSYKIERDDEKFLVVTFRYIKESLPSKFQFLGDCDARVYCRKDTKLMSYAEFVSFQPTKVKMLNVNEVLVEMYYTYDEESKTYVHQEARLDMKVMLFGNEQPVEMINNYYEYKVVK